MPCGVGGTHRSWPGGQGGKLRALVAGWMAVPKEGRALGPPLGPRLGLAGVSKVFGAGGGRWSGHGPQGRSKFRNLRRFFHKKKKMIFFEGCVGWGCVRGRGCGSGGVGGRGTGPRDGANFAMRTKGGGAGLVDREVNQGPWLQERVGGGRRAGWQFHCGVGGVPTGAGLVDRAVNQGAWLQERVWRGVGARWQFERRGRVGPKH